MRRIALALLTAVLLAVPHAVAQTLTIPSGVTTVSSTVAGVSAAVTFTNTSSTSATASMSFVINGVPHTLMAGWNVDQSRPHSATLIRDRYIQPAIFRMVQSAYLTAKLPYSPDKIADDTTAILTAYIH